MIMCKAASISALDSYQNDITSLVDLHPHTWHLIVVADEVCRSERWPHTEHPGVVRARADSGVSEKKAATHSRGEEVQPTPGFEQGQWVLLS